jgi:hypothetical protein
MLIGYAQVSTDEQHPLLHPDRGVRSLLGLIAASHCPKYMNPDG